MKRHKLEYFMNMPRNIFEDFSPSNKEQEERDKAFIMLHQTKTWKIHHPVERNKKHKFGDFPFTWIHDFTKTINPMTKNKRKFFERCGNS
jgi:hypothetical protein